MPLFGQLPDYQDPASPTPVGAPAARAGNLGTLQTLGMSKTKLRRPQELQTSYDQAAGNAGALRERNDQRIQKFGAEQGQLATLAGQQTEKQGRELADIQAEDAGRLQSFAARRTGMVGGSNDASQKAGIAADKQVGYNTAANQGQQLKTGMLGNAQNQMRDLGVQNQATPMGVQGASGMLRAGQEGYQGALNQSLAQDRASMDQSADVEETRLGQLASLQGQENQRNQQAYQNYLAQIYGASGQLQGLENQGWLNRASGMMGLNGQYYGEETGLNDNVSAVRGRNSETAIQSAFAGLQGLGTMAAAGMSGKPAQKKPWGPSNGATAQVQSDLRPTAGGVDYDNPIL